MASRRRQGQADPFAALPAHLQAEARPMECGRCEWCGGVRWPGQCAEIVAYNAARKQWCTEHGVTLLELMIKEHGNRRPLFS